MTLFSSQSRANVALLLAVLSSAALTGCATKYVPFTQELRVRHGLTDDDLQQLQYFVSNEVKLRREVHTVGRDITGGELKLLEGKTVEEVVIEEQTPCVAVNIDSSAITVSFEEGSELRFSLRDAESMAYVAKPSLGGFAEPPNPFPDSESEPPPAADEPIDQLLGSYWLDANSDAMVAFRGRQWNGMADTFRAHLVIDAESLEEVTETRSVLGGRKVGDNAVRTKLIMVD